MKPYVFLVAVVSKTEEGFAGRAEVTLTAFGRSVPALAKERRGE